MKQTTQIGSTVEEAISLALQKLGYSIEQVDVEVLQEGKKGFFGFGSRPAEVSVTVKEVVQEIHSEPVNSVVETETKVDSLAEQQENHLEPVKSEEQHLTVQHDPVEEVYAYLKGIAQGMGIEDLVIQHETQGKNTIFSLESKKAALLIGKRGNTLNSLQQLAQLVYNKYANSFMMVHLDVENYRERRQEILEKLAENMADKAIRTGETVKLEPMPSYERKVIHHTLSRRLDIETYSEGTEPNRYLVIEPLR